MLIRGLPRTSRTTASVTGLRWPEPAEVIADLWDVTVAMNWSVQGRDAPKYPRPWVKPDVVAAGGGMDPETYAAWRAKQFQPVEGGDPDGG